MDNRLDLVEPPDLTKALDVVKTLGIQNTRGVSKIEGQGVSRIEGQGVADRLDDSYRLDDSDRLDNDLSYDNPGIVVSDVVRITPPRCKFISIHLTTAIITSNQPKGDIYPIASILML